MKKRIAVVGGDGPIPPDVDEAAELVGKNIAEKDCTLICGGRGGVMEAACRGAEKAGGTTVGILPSHDGSDANKHVMIAIPTGLGFARNSIVVSSADAVIAVAGSTGTLSEIAMALNFDKPVVVVYGVGGVSERVREAFPGDERIKKIVDATAGEAVEKALALVD